MDERTNERGTCSEKGILMKWIAVVEDDPTTLRMMQEILESVGYGVLTCTNGAALEAALQDLPDLIILDVLLLNEDGLELCRRVKTDRRTQHVPVVLYSVKRISTEGLEASGADSFLKKPFHLEELLALVHRYI